MPNNYNQERTKKFGQQERRHFTCKEQKREEIEWSDKVKKQNQLIGLLHKQAIAYIKQLTMSYFGFIENPSLTPNQNTYNTFCKMPCWYYFGWPTNTAFHNFCKADTPIPRNLEFLLGLGLKFIPTPFFTTNDISKTTNRLEKSLALKKTFAGQEPDDKDCHPKIYTPSKWKPRPWMLSNELTYRCSRFFCAIMTLFQKQRGTPNFLPTQCKILQNIRNHEDTIMVYTPTYVILE